MTLTVRFWGTRGSIPSPGPATTRYGGNTTCVEVATSAGGSLILDAGTGIRELGRSLVARGDGAVDADLLLSHLHWDHIQGFPFFAPLYESGNRLCIWGAAARAEESHERIVRGLMSPRVFPIGFDQLAATVEFRTVPDGEWSCGGCMVRSAAVWHPGGALGYRVRAEGSEAAVVFIPDNELRAAASDPVGRARVRDLCAGARLLIHDCTYIADEYEHHRGWGHSTVGDALALALESGVERLALFHHAPERSDAAVDALLEDALAEMERHGNPIEVIAAAEGLAVEL